MVLLDYRKLNVINTSHLLNESLIGEKVDSGADAKNEEGEVKILARVRDRK